MDSLNKQLARWQSAGLLTDEIAARILAFEEREAHPERQRWQIRLALIFGAVLSSAGILLFIAAHWDHIGTGTRLALVLGTLALLHLGGTLVRSRFDALATTLHGIGTVCLGGAIALAGQIFNMQEHWPAAILLWALAAAAGWWLLRDSTQQVLAMLLTPAWLLCELGDRIGPYSGGDVYVARLLLVLAAIYLVSFLNTQPRAVTNWLATAAGAAIPGCVAILSEGWRDGYTAYRWGFLPVGWRVATAAAVILLLAGCWLLNRRSLPVVLGAAFVGYALPWLLRPQVQTDDSMNRNVMLPMVWQPSIVSYLLLTLAATGLAWWGVRQRKPGIVNYATVAFGAVVVWFYFSDLMDRMDRSISLIGLGVVFLAGGYGLDRLRRRLLLQIQYPEAHV